MLESGRTADLRMLVMAALRQSPVGKGDSRVHSELGNRAGTKGNPQNLPKGDAGPAGARGNS